MSLRLIWRCLYNYSRHSGLTTSSHSKQRIKLYKIKVVHPPSGINCHTVCGVKALLPLCAVSEPLYLNCVTYYYNIVTRFKVSDSFYSRATVVQKFQLVDYDCKSLCIFHEARFSSNIWFCNLFNRFIPFPVGNVWILLFLESNAPFGDSPWRPCFSLDNWLPATMILIWWFDLFSSTAFLPKRWNDWKKC